MTAQEIDQAIAENAAQSALNAMNAQVDAGATYTWFDMVGVLRQAGADDAWIAQALDMPLVYVQYADIYLDPDRDRGTNYYNER